jgi:hypothetical protein
MKKNPGHICPSLKIDILRVRMENELQVIGDIETIPIHGGDHFHEIIEKTEEWGSLKGVSEGDIVVVRIEEAQGLVKKGKQRFRGGKDDGCVFVHPLLLIDPAFQHGAYAEDLAVRIRALITMDFRLGGRESSLSRDSQVGQFFLHALTVLKNEEGVSPLHEGSKNIFLRFREGKKPCKDHSFETIQI